MAVCASLSNELLASCSHRLKLSCGAFLRLDSKGGVDETEVAVEVI